jgi:hypothetical protein
MRPSTWAHIAAASLSACLALFGCGSDGPGGSTGSVCPTSSALNYESFGQTFMATHCLSCHASKESPPFNTVEQIRARASDIDRAAAAGPSATNTYMPEDGSVPLEERQKLGEWLACGAP